METLRFPRLADQLPGRASGRPTVWPAEQHCLMTTTTATYPTHHSRYIRELVNN